MSSTSLVVRVVRLLIGFAVLVSLGVSLIASQPALEPFRGRMIPSGMALLVGIGVVGMLLGLCGVLRRNEELIRQAEAALKLQCMATGNGSNGSQRTLAVPQPAASGAPRRPTMAPDSHSDREVPADTLALQLFRQLKTEIACRNWRMARTTAHRLMESCPNHPKTLATRAQKKLIEQNAEVEERKEIELRIGELFKSGRYGDGIEMAEKLIQQYPSSPQAKAAQRWLPRLRARLAEKKPVLS